jgi:hypothetical protein
LWTKKLHSKEVFNGVQDKFMSHKTLLGVLVIATSVIDVGIWEENALIIQMKNSHILK